MRQCVLNALINRTANVADERSNTPGSMDGKEEREDDVMTAAPLLSLILDVLDGDTFDTESESEPQQLTPLAD